MNTSNGTTTARPSSIVRSSANPQGARGNPGANTAANSTSTAPCRGTAWRTAPIRNRLTRKPDIILSPPP